MSTLSPNRSVFAPFDSIAPDYDLLFTYTCIGRAQRQAVWSKMAEVFRPGNRVLEINCGTGVDAVFLARMGVEVLALDSSTGMLAVARERIEQECVHDRVTVQQKAIEQLDELEAEAPFDGVLSNFGGLNCVGNLAKFAEDLARVVKPGGSVLLCLMGPWCLWEIAYYLFSLQPRKAFRRTSSRRVTVPLGKHTGHRQHRLGRPACSAGLPVAASARLVQVHYPSVRHLAGVLAPSFRVRSYQAVGLVVPPSYIESLIANRPKMLKFLSIIDSRIADWRALRNFGDHYLVHLERLQ